jgi:hypothetical protein
MCFFRQEANDAQGYYTKLFLVNESVEEAMDDQTRVELEAAAFRQLVQHLRERA